MLRQDTDRVILLAKTMGRNGDNKEDDLLKYYRPIYYVVYYSVGLPIETPRKKPLKVIDFQGLWNVVAVRTELETLKAEIDIVKAQIELTELRAPFDGVIGLRQISVGAYASPTTIVSKLTRIIPLKVEFSVPERYVNEVNPGTALTFTIDGSLQNFPAKVYAKESAIDENTHTLKVRALYENPNGRLTPGRYASINLKKQEIQDAIAIPAEAIVPEMGKDKVFLYKSGKAQPVEVTVGLRTEERVQVLKGLQVGDTLITSGTLQLRTDLPVVLDRVE